MKSDMELELKSYLKTALKKLMLFKKELKADLLFTKDQCTREVKQRHREEQERVKREVESWILEQHVKPLYMAQNDQTVILSQHLGEQKAAMVKGIEKVREEVNTKVAEIAKNVLRQGEGLIRKRLPWIQDEIMKSIG